MPQFSILDRQRVLAVARHECGHYIAARTLGFEPGKLALTILLPYGHRGESEQTLHQNIETKQQVLDFLERRAQVLCAGVIAEATSSAGVYDNDAAVKLMREGGGADQDYGKYREIVYLMRNIIHGDTTDGAAIEAELKEVENTIWNKAGGLVQAEHQCIEGLAQRLASEVKQFNLKAELSWDELRKLPALVQRFRRVNSW